MPGRFDRLCAGRADALPHAVQVADRWHLWHGLCDAASKEAAAHSACWATATGLREGKLAETTLQQWQQIHALLEAGVGLLDCSRRLGLALNTVKRYARAATPERIQRVPQYQACMVDPSGPPPRPSRTGASQCLAFTDLGISQAP